MRTQKKGRIAFAVCGSFCTLEAALAAAQQLTEQGWELLPIMSFAAKQDTRFGTGQFWQERLEALTGHAVLDTLQAVEPLGPKKLVSAPWHRRHEAAPAWLCSMALSRPRGKTWSLHSVAQAVQPLRLSTKRINRRNLMQS